MAGQIKETMTEQTWAQQRRQFDDMITLYGRKTTLEVLKDTDLKVFRLHLATSNKSSSVISEIKHLAAVRNVELRMHSKHNLSYISKNARQDQGVAIDLVAPHYHDMEQLVTSEPKPGAEFIMIDRVTNPQNLGMIIRSVAASPMAGLILPTQGCAAIDPLVYKASAGCLLKTTIYRCLTGLDGALALQRKGYQLIGLSSEGELRLSDLNNDTPKILILGNETEGLSTELRDACDHLLGIPMANAVDSLNVAVTAGIISFHGSL